ncbi:MAG: aldo/keto reductase, partial [Promethearchaeota archaeon]
WKVKAREDVEKLCDEQMAKLQTEYLDIYLVHALSKKRMEIVRNCNVIDEMKKLKEKGKIKHIGFSFHDNVTAFKEIIDEFEDTWECCQIQYNYVDTGIQATTEGLKYAASKGLAVIIMEPVKGGKLAHPPSEVIEIFNSAPKVRTPVDWALQFLWNKPEVSIVLSGMSNFQQVKENLESADKSGIGTLSREEIEILERVVDVSIKSILVPCTACEYCMPCPSGVNIPRNFHLLNELSRNKKVKAARKLYQKLASVTGELNESKDNGMASMCTNCKQCIEKCPQAINIPEELEKVHRVLGEGLAINDVFPAE